MSKDWDELMPNYAPVNNNVVVQTCPNKCCDTGNQAPGIRLAFALDSEEREVVLGTLITLQPIQTKVGDRIKLDAMVQINTETDGTGGLALSSVSIALRRRTLLPGQDTTTSTELIIIRIRDDELNNPEGTGGNDYTRIASLTWVDIPPAGINTYSLETVGIVTDNIESRTYSNRSLNATIFPIGYALN
ncbi:MAG: hypothetical protein ACOX42_05130 [Clostridia bacterium]|jgi:hypothetical protein|nr:hypothetical protein [Clostridiales bacterium]